MERIRVSVMMTVLVAGLLVGGSAEAADVTISDRDGAPVGWSDWAAENGPSAVVLWASWAPGADDTLAGLDALRAAAADKGLSLVLVSVQESLGEARRALGNDGPVWLHDRYGALLKTYRVVEIPALVIIDAEAGVVGRMDASAEALRGWTRK